jgi:hypothetical protein
VGGYDEAATAPAKVSTPAAQTRFVLEAMEAFQEKMLARFDQMEGKFEALEKVQVQLQGVDLLLHKHAEVLEQMQVKVNLSMDTLGQVQAEQNWVSSSLKGPGVTPLTIPQREEVSILGEPPDRRSALRVPSVNLATGFVTTLPKVTSRHQLLHLRFMMCLVPVMGVIVIDERRTIGVVGCQRWISLSLMAQMCVFWLILATPSSNYTTLQKVLRFQQLPCT